MRILVTGSHGFIGSQLVKKLREEGHNVIRCDIKNHFDLNDAFYDIGLIGQAIDVIYHLACVNQMEAVGEFTKNFRVNTLGAKTMALLANETGTRLIYTSTASVYGNQPVYPIPVTARTDPKSDYAIAKLAGEQFIRNSGCDYSIVRLSNVYGPGMQPENPYSGVVFKFFEAALAGKPIPIIGDGKQTRDFSYIDDVIDILVDLGKTVPESVRIGDSRLMNVSSGVETTIYELALRIGLLVSKHPVFQYAPERPVDGINRRVLVPDLYCNTSLDRGLEKTLEWLNASIPGRTETSSSFT